MDKKPVAIGLCIVAAAALLFAIFGRGGGGMKLGDITLVDVMTGETTRVDPNRTAVRPAKNSDGIACLYPASRKDGELKIDSMYANHLRENFGSNADLKVDLDTLVVADD